MPAAPSLTLIAKLSAALAGDDAQDALNRAVAVLGELGIVAAPTDRPGEPWVRVGERGRQLALGPPAVADSVDDATRACIGDLLRAGLARVVEHDEHQRTRERLDMLSAASFEGIFIHVDGLIIDANQRFTEMLGYDREEIIGHDPAPMCVAPEDLPMVREVVAQQREGAYVITGVRKDGSRFRAEISSKQGYLGARPVRVVAVRDVTERERLTALLRESETRLRALAEEAFDAIVYSRGGAIVEVGGPIEDLLGYTREQLLGQPVLGFVAPESLAEAAGRIEQDRVGAYEVNLVDAHGRVIPVEIVSVLSTLDGLPARVAGLRDLRQARRMENDLRTSDEALRKLNAELESRISDRTAQLSTAIRELESFSYSVSHDLRAPLRAINGFAVILLEDHAAEVGPEAQDYLRQIRAATVRMGELVDGLLTLARLGRVEVRHEPVDLSAIARDVIAALAAEAPARVVKVSVEPGLEVRGDPALMRTALANLLGNAWKFSGRRADAEVRVAARETAHGRAFVVSDNGVGFDMAHAGMLFKPFHRLHGEREFVGSGIGLATVARVIRRHGGEIWAEAEPGGGASFLFTVPSRAP